MKIIEGSYIKKDGTQRDVNVFVLEENVDYIKGLDLTLLTSEELDLFNEVKMSFDTVIGSLMKTSFRNFKKENLKITNEE